MAMYITAAVIGYLYQTGVFRIRLGRSLWRLFTSRKRSATRRWGRRSSEQQQQQQQQQRERTKGMTTITIEINIRNGRRQRYRRPPHVAGYTDAMPQSWFGELKNIRLFLFGFVVPGVESSKFATTTTAAASKRTEQRQQQPTETPSSRLKNPHFRERAPRVSSSNETKNNELSSSYEYTHTQKRTINAAADFAASAFLRTDDDREKRDDGPTVVYVYVVRTVIIIIILEQQQEQQRKN